MAVIVLLIGFTGQINRATTPTGPASLPQVVSAGSAATGTAGMFVPTNGRVLDTRPGGAGNYGSRCPP